MTEQRVSACVAMAVVLLAAWLATPALCAEGVAADTTATDTSTFARVMAKAWSRDAVFPRVKGVFVADNTLYVLGAPRGLAAIDPATGVTRWLHVGRYPVDTQPTKLGDLISFAEGGELVGISEATGVETSRTKVRVGIRTPVYPTDDGYWVITSADDRVYGVSPKDGRRLWHVTVNDLVTGSDWSEDQPDTAIYMSHTGTLSAVGLRMRGFLWQTPFRKPACSAPTLAYPVVFVGCEDYFLYALWMRSGTEAWRICLSAPVLDKPVVAHGRVYAMTADHVLHAVDIAQKQEAWALAEAGRVLTATAEWVVMQRLVKDTHLVTVVDAATGKVAARATAAKHDFFAADPDAGVFFAVSEEGNVLALGVRTIVEAQAATQATRASEKLSRAATATTTTVPAKAAAGAAQPAKGAPAGATPTTTVKPAGGGQKYFLVH